MPILVVSVTVGGGVAPKVQAVVDSGADVTMLPAWIVEACGMAWADIPSPVEEGHGAGGKFEHKACDGLVEWRGVEICQRFHVIAPEKDPDDRLDFGLLGRSDFFSRYNVQFNWHRTPPVMYINELGQAAKTSRGRKR